MALTYDGTQGITFNDGTQVATSNSLGMRNKIINGAMNINQRGWSGTISSQTYTLDRWQAAMSQGSKYSVQQNASPAAPSGFANYLAATSLSAYSIGAGDYFCVGQAIEGNNFYDFNFGTSNAKTVTLSFWVYSSLTGTFGGTLQNYTGTRSYPFAYTVLSANTWQKVSITIPGDTSGTWVGQSNAGAATLWFGLGVGSTFSATAGTWASGNYISSTGATSVVGTNFATFYITGVQLEAGTVPTAFENRQYGQELALCQRYYEVHGGVAYTFPGADMYGVTGQAMAIGVPFAVTKRTTPTVSATGTWNYNNASGITAYAPSVAGYDLYASVTSTGRSSFFPSATGFVTATAEL